MRDDPIVEEARAAGQAYFDSLGGDWKAIIADLERRAREEGRRLIAAPAPKERNPAGPTKKVPG